MLKSIVLAYFTINIIASIVNLTMEIIRPSPDFKNNRDREIYRVMSAKDKFLLYAMTFAVNCVLWFPLKLIQLSQRKNS